MQVGNRRYRMAEDIAETVPVFPLTGALLLPAGRLPLNIFEPRYLEMVDHVLARHRLIGMVQPSLDAQEAAGEPPGLCEVGCLGRITMFSESGDGRYLITLEGVCRFRIDTEIAAKTPFRQCRIRPFVTDLEEEDTGSGEVDRPALLRAFEAYLKANDLEADWDSVRRADNATLVNALSMMAPYGAAEKQALLEAPNLKARAETLIAITEMALVRDSDDFATSLQ